LKVRRTENVGQPIRSEIALTQRLRVAQRASGKEKDMCETIDKLEMG
jgi:hypothetical protein